MDSPVHSNSSSSPYNYSPGSYQNPFVDSPTYSSPHSTSSGGSLSGKSPHSITIPIPTKVSPLFGFQFRPASAPLPAQQDQLAPDSDPDRHRQYYVVNNSQPDRPPSPASDDEEERGCCKVSWCAWLCCFGKSERE
jgi:hypothetical protein